MPRPDDSGGPPHSRQYRMLLCCLRCTLKPSASAIVISKLYQHFRVRDHPYGLQNSLPTLNPSCSLQNFMHLRHGSKARYGWVANPYRKSLLFSLPTGTFTLQDTPSFARRDNEKFSGRQGEKAYAKDKETLDSEINEAARPCLSN